MSDTALQRSIATPAEQLHDWVILLKPRVVSLVVITGLIGLLIAPGHLHPLLAFAAIVCIGVGAGAAGAINMSCERDIDALMRRTRSRPVPSGRIAEDAAMAFGVLLAIASVVVMALAANFLAAGVLAISISFYVFVYTLWLKRRTPANIVIGGAAGAFPPLIGWVAVTGHLDLLPILLFAIIFLWTPPHFWSLSLYADVDYARAGVPMLPVVAGPATTRRRIAIYTLALVGCSMLPWCLGLAGPVYAIAAAILGLGYLLVVRGIYCEPVDAQGCSLTRNAAARTAFRYSLYYLGVLFAALAVDRVFPLW
jgi:heme o synthase